MSNSKFIRASALAMALTLACTALPFSALAATDMSTYSTSEFEEAYTYEGEDLGAVWTKDATTFHFSRISADGIYSNGSYCGNDTASERSMAQEPDADRQLRILP